MILFDSLECGDFAHEKADFRGLVHGMFKTEHLRVTCRHGRICAQLMDIMGVKITPSV